MLYLCYQFVNRKVKFMAQKVSHVHFHRAPEHKHGHSINKRVKHAPAAYTPSVDGRIKMINKNKEDKSELNA